MTGELVDRVTTEQLAQGGTHTLQKPFRISELVSEILTGALAGGSANTPGPSARLAKQLLSAAFYGA